MRVLLFVAPLVMAAAPQYGGQPVARMSTSSFSEKELASLVKTHAKNREYTISVRGADGSVKAVLPRGPDAPKLTELPRASLVGLYTVLSLKGDPEGREFDLVVDTPGGDALATIWFEEGGLVVDSVPTWTPPAPVESAAFRARWPDHPLIEEGAPWTPELLGALDQSLALLVEADRRAIAGTAFVRRPAPKKNVGGTRLEPPKWGFAVRGGGFEQAEEGSRVELYNQGVKSDTAFVGSLSQPHPAVCWHIMVELGRAIVAGSASTDIPSESFPAIFALFYLDPEALQRVQPAAYEAFKAARG